MLIITHCTTSEPEDQPCENLERTMSSDSIPVKEPAEKDEVRTRRSCRQLSDRTGGGGGEIPSGKAYLRATRSETATARKQRKKRNLSNLTMRKNPAVNIGEVDDCVPEAISNGLEQFPPFPSHFLGDSKEAESALSASDEQQLILQMTTEASELLDGVKCCLEATRCLKRDTCFTLISLICLMISKSLVEAYYGNRGGKFWTHEMEETLRKYFAHQQRWEGYFGTWVGKFFHQAMGVVSSNLWDWETMNPFHQPQA